MSRAAIDLLIWVGLASHRPTQLFIPGSIHEDFCISGKAYTSTTCGVKLDLSCASKLICTVVNSGESATGGLWSLEPLKKHRQEIFSTEHESYITVDT